MNDKRKHPRQTIRREIFYFLEEEGTTTSKRVYYRGTIIDRSARGLGLLVTYPHRPRERLWFEALERDGEPRAACIRWVQDRQGRYGMGVELMASPRGSPEADLRGP